MRLMFFALLVFPLCLCAQPARIKPPTKPQTIVPVKPQKRVTQTIKASYKDELLNVNGVHYKMILVDGGTFRMGATPEQGSNVEVFVYEKPVHNVTLNSYYIGRTEVTQTLWQAVMGSNPSSNWKGDNLPVEDVSWDDCQTFITKLNKITGKKFRLPTEAEWEYAARGGTKSNGYKYSGSNNLDDVAWYDSNTHPVATKQANELGIYDMSGNVREWCQDWYDAYSSLDQINPIGPSSGSKRVVRGGGWSGEWGPCRSSYRDAAPSSFRIHFLGLRLALSQVSE